MPASLDEARYRWDNADATCAHEYVLAPVLELLARFEPAGCRIVDIGCGNGAATGHLAAQGYSIAGFDSSSDGIGIARQAWPELGFVEASIDDPELRGKVGTGFDAAVSLEVVEHLVYPRRLFLRARELLKPGGTLVVSTPYHGYFKNLVLSVVGRWDQHFTVGWDGGHIKFFSRRSLTDMAAEAGFRLAAFRGAGRLPFLWKSMVVAFRLELPPPGAAS